VTQLTITNPAAESAASLGVNPPAMLLAPLAAPISSLAWLSASLAAVLMRAVGGGTLLDLLFHLPEGPVIDRRYRPTLAEAEAGRIATLAVTVQGVERPARPRQPWRVRITDDSGEAELVFFSPHQARGLAVGERIMVSGRLDAYGNRLSMAHPDYLVPIARAASIPQIEAVWPLTAGLVPKVVASALRGAFEHLPPLPEWLEPSVLQREGWPGFAEALRRLHFPGDALRDDATLSGATVPAPGSPATSCWRARSRPAVPAGAAACGRGAPSPARARCAARCCDASATLRPRRRCARWRRSTPTSPPLAGCCGCCRAT